jgi:hypothetical protein
VRPGDLAGARLATGRQLLAHIGERQTPRRYVNKSRCNLVVLSSQISEAVTLTSSSIYPPEPISPFIPPLRVCGVHPAW